MTRRAAPERAIQMAIRHALKLHDAESIAIPNGGKRTLWEGRMLRAEGLTPGAPDLLLIGRGAMGFLEVKAPGGRLSEAQVAFHDMLRRRGQLVETVRSVDEAIATIKAWGWR
jgi:hypothetical protein